jgi:hypothetical protein
MKNKLLVFILFIVSNSFFAQQNITASGATISGSGGSASYSVGQVDFQYVSNLNGEYAEGVQNPQEVLTLSIDAFEGNSFSVFPNPFLESVNLKFENDFKGSYSVYDMSGKVVKEGLLNGLDTLLNFQDNQRGVYILNIISTNNAKKQFKLIKK